MQPIWFTTGKPVAAVMERSGDAEFILEDEEFDLNWIECDVPVEAFGIAETAFADYAAQYCAHEYSPEKFANVETWVAEVGDMETALQDSPLLCYLRGDGLNILDGYHRFGVARYKHGLTTIKALVAVPEPTLELSDEPSTPTCGM